MQSSEDLDKKTKNESIQLGILIKAYGQLGLLDLAFSTFYEHKSDPTNNDIVFGCLIDACVKTENILKAEETFNKILSGGWMGI